MIQDQEDGVKYPGIHSHLGHAKNEASQARSFINALVSLINKISRGLARTLIGFDDSPHPFIGADPQSETMKLVFSGKGAVALFMKAQLEAHTFLFGHGREVNEARNKIDSCFKSRVEFKEQKFPALFRPLWVTHRGYLNTQKPSFDGYRWNGSEFEYAYGVNERLGRMSVLFPGYSVYAHFHEDVSFICNEKLYCDEDIGVVGAIYSHLLARSYDDAYDLLKKTAGIQVSQHSDDRSLLDAYVKSDVFKRLLDSKAFVDHVDNSKGTLVGPIRLMSRPDNGVSISLKESEGPVVPFDAVSSASLSFNVQEGQIQGFFDFDTHGMSDGYKADESVGLINEVNHHRFMLVTYLNAFTKVVNYYC